MTSQPPPRGGGWSSPGGADDDGWGPSTAVRGGGGGRPSRSPEPVVTPHRRGRPSAPPAGSDGWSPAGPAPRQTQRGDRVTERSIQDLSAGPRRRERGLPWWAALLLLIVIAVIGGVIDTVGSIQVRGGFNIGIVVASVVAILVVKRSHMFPIVIAPPIVYSFAALFQLYLRSSGLHDKKVVFDAAANYLVYGFPAIAAAVAAVLIIAGIRMITRR